MMNSREIKNMDFSIYCCRWKSLYVNGNRLLHPVDGVVYVFLTKHFSACYHLPFRIRATFYYFKFVVDIVLRSRLIKGLSASSKDHKAKCLASFKCLVCIRYQGYY